MADHSYTVVIERDEDGFVVSCPALPGCHSQGDTLDEARANIREAIELYIDVAREHGDVVPGEAPVIVEAIRLAG